MARGSFAVATAPRRLNVFEAGNQSRPNFTSNPLNMDIAYHGEPEGRHIRESLDLRHAVRR